MPQGASRHAIGDWHSQYTACYQIVIISLRGARDRRGKRRTLEYLTERLTPAELAELCVRLSTEELPLGVAFDTDSGENGVQVRVGEE